MRAGMYGKAAFAARAESEVGSRKSARAPAAPSLSDLRPPTSRAYAPTLACYHRRMSESISAVFVYGTLKQGDVRAHLWPRPPQSIEPAVIRGRMHDLGPYPALVDGGDPIAG